MFWHGICIVFCMGHSYTNLLYHLVFSTKYRINLITPDIREGLYNYIGGIIRGEKGVMLSIGGVSDHIHIAAKFRPDITVSEMLKRIKAHSSTWANQNFPNKSQIFQWQNGYGAFTIGKSQLKPLIQYIENQETHHKKNTFSEELRTLIKKYEN